MSTPPRPEELSLSNPDSFTPFVMYYQRPLFAFLGRMGFARAIAEELAQETFTRAWKSIADYDHRRAAFSTWLFAIARHLALNELARARTARSGPDAASVEAVVGDDQAPSEALEVEQRAQRLRRALLGLSPADRAVIALAYIRDLPLIEVARIEGISLSATKVRLHRAKARLRALLEESHD